MAATTRFRKVIRPTPAWAKCGISAATGWRRVKDDPTFPKPFPLGTQSRAVGFFEDEIDAWLDDCASGNKK